MPPKFHIRRLFPARGAAYELFDASILLLALGLIGYVLTEPPSTAQATLTVLRFVSEDTLGWALTIAATVGIVSAYTPWIRVGYIAVIGATLSMTGFYALGYLVNEGSDDRALLSAIIYGWIARRLIRDAA